MCSGGIMGLGKRLQLDYVLRTEYDESRMKGIINNVRDDNCDNTGRVVAGMDYILCDTIYSQQ